MQIIRIVCLFGLFLFSFGWHTLHFARAFDGGSALYSVQRAEEAFRTGHFAEAIYLWENALAQEEKTATSQTRVDFLMRLAAAYQAQGLHSKTLEQVTKALAIADKNQDPLIRAQTLGRLSDLMLAVGATEDALKYVDEAFDYARKSGDPLTLAQIHNNRGNVLSILGEYSASEAMYQESMRLAQEAKQPLQVVVAVINRVRNVMAYADDEMATTQLLAAAQTVQNLPDTKEKSEYLASIGFLLWKMHQSLPETVKARDKLLLVCHQLFSEARDRAAAMGNTKLTSIALGYLGGIYEDSKRYAESLRLTQQAIFYAQESGAPDILYRWQWQQGRIFKAMKRFDEAVAVYERAVKTLKPIRSILDIGYRSPLHSFTTSIKPVYYELADLLLRQAENTQEKAEQQRLLKAAQNTIEMLKVAELENYYQSDCVLPSQEWGITHVDKKTLVVYPIILQDRWVVLVTLPGGMIKQIPIAMAGKRLEETVRLLAVGLQTRPLNRFLYQAEELYNWMIRPIEKDLINYEVNTIIYVPDGLLRTVPLSVFYDGKKFLIEKYAVATIPGLNLTKPKAMEKRDIRVLVAGISQGVQGYAPLPSGATEMAFVEKITKGEVIMNKEFTSAQFKKRMEETPFSIIHLTTHAEFNGDHGDSFLLTYDDKINMSKLEDWVGLGRYRKTPVELLALSACQTALGDDRAALGLAGVAVKAGARSVMATLWFVDDEATSLVLMDFYAQLFNTPGLTKAQALQNAQKKLIAQKRYWHPAYWAPFLLIGNWL